MFQSSRVHCLEPDHRLLGDRTQGPSRCELNSITALVLERGTRTHVAYGCTCPGYQTWDGLPTLVLFLVPFPWRLHKTRKWKKLRKKKKKKKKLRRKGRSTGGRCTGRLSHQPSARVRVHHPRGRQSDDVKPGFHCPQSSYCRQTVFFEEAILRKR